MSNEGLPSGMTTDIPEEILVVWRAFLQGFNMPGRVALGKIRPEGTNTDFYVMSVIPLPGEDPVPLAIIPLEGVPAMIYRHAKLLEHYGAPPTLNQMN